MSLKKLKLELPYDPVISFLGIFPKECTPGYDGATCESMFIEELFTIAKLCKQPRCPMTEECMKKMVYMHNRVLFTHKEE
jgi:hypothetical protein